MHGIKHTIQKQRTAFIHGVSGVEPVTLKEYRMLNTRMKRAVATYGFAEIIVNLRSIVHLSYTQFERLYLYTDFFSAECWTILIKSDT